MNTNISILTVRIHNTLYEGKSHYFTKNKNKQTNAQFTNLLEPNENTKVKLTNEEQKFSVNKQSLIISKNTLPYS